MTQKKINNKIFGECLDIVEDFLFYTEQEIIGVIEWGRLEGTDNYEVVCYIKVGKEQSVAKFLVDTKNRTVVNMELPSVKP